MKGMIKKCTLYVLSFALLLTALSSVFSASAGAIAVPDVTTDKLFIGVEPCQIPQDMTLTSYEIIDPDNDTSMYHFTRAQRTSGGSLQDIQDFANEWKVRVQNSTRGWGMIQGYGEEIYGSQSPIITFVLSNNPDDTLQQVGAGLVAPNGFKAVSFAVNPNNCRYQTARIVNAPGSNQIVQQFETYNMTDASAKILYFNFNIAYDSSWTGPGFPQGPEAPAVEYNVLPDGAYRVENLYFNFQTALTLRQSIEKAFPAYPKVLNVPNGYLTYYMQKCTDDTYSSCDENIDTKAYVPVNDPYEFTFPSTGHYKLLVAYDFPSFVPKPANPEEGELKYLPVGFPLNIDGSSYNGSTIDCLNGVCPEPTPYEDCSTYGTDIVGGLGCQFRNFGVLIQTVITNLFVPNPTFLKSYQENLTGFFNEKLGFLATSVGFVGTFFTNIINSATTPQCVIESNDTLFGVQPRFDVCVLQSIYAPAFYAMQVLIIGITCVGLFFAGLRKYHEVVDRR